MCATSKSVRSEQPSGTITEPAITLQRSTPGDAELLFAWRAEPSAARFQPLQPMSLAALRNQLRERTGVPLDPAFTGKVQWIVGRGGEPVGWISLRVTDREQGTGAVGLHDR